MSEHYCKPWDAGLDSEPAEVAKRLGNLLEALDTQITAHVASGELVDAISKLKMEAIARLRDEGWDVRFYQTWRVSPPKVRTYRCTRNSLYQHDCAGRDNVKARQGHYIDAKSPREALDEMTQRFPEDSEGIHGHGIGVSTRPSDRAARFERWPVRSRTREDQDMKKTISVCQFPPGANQGTNLFRGTIERHVRKVTLRYNTGCVTKLYTRVCEAVQVGGQWYEATTKGAPYDPGFDNKPTIYLHGNTELPKDLKTSGA